MSFQRQLERQMQKASLNQQMALVEDTVNALSAENTQLNMEVKSLHRAMGAIVQAAGGEVRIPKDIDSILKGKQLQSDFDGETNEYIFRIVDATAAVEESSEEAATN